MKKMTFLLAFILFINLSNAQKAKGVNLVITVENVLADGGEILAGLHNADTFMKSNGIADVMMEAKKGTLSFTFKDVKPGSYAVMVMHDVNSNKNMDYDSNGMPKESYGMSGSGIPMGPPTFEAAKFEVADKDLELSIRF
jgi:uncharacterized protein (DUF2141 family)